MSWQFFAQHYADPTRQNREFDPKYDPDHGGIVYPGRQHWAAARSIMPSAFVWECMG